MEMHCLRGRRQQSVSITMVLLSILCLFVFPTHGSTEPLMLDPAEREWVRAHQSLRVANEMDWPPFDFVEEGEPKGYSIDLVRLVAERAGLEVEFVNGLTWAELVDLFRRGEIDVLPAVYESEERKEYALFTPSYFSQPSVMVVREDDDTIGALEDLRGRKVAAIRGFMISDTLRDQFPWIIQVPVDSVVEGMNAVSTGDADAFIDSIGVVSHISHQAYIPNITVLTNVPLEQLANPDLHMGVPNDQEILAGILTKGIAAVTDEEKEKIRARWLHLPTKAGLTQQQAMDEAPSANPFSPWVLLVTLVVIVGLAVLSRVVDRPVTEAEMARMSGARRFWVAVSFSNLNISAKILLILVLVAATSVGLFGYMDYKEARRSLSEESFKKLTAVREMKAQQVEDYFTTISGQVLTFSESRTIIDAMHQLGQAFAALEEEASTDHGGDAPADPELIAYYENEFLPRLQANTAVGLEEDAYLSFIPKSAHSRHLQEEYIAESPHPTGEKHRLDEAGDGSNYSAVHRFYHPIIRKYLEEFGYYDIFLVDHDTGHIVYSVFKEVDYATSLLTGPYRDTNFATAFRAARNADESEFVRLVDFQPYAPSYNAPAAFIASPIFDEGEKIGVLVFQMPIDRINDIMTSHNLWRNVGLGDSGETYLVGYDYLMRNQSRFLIEDRENYLLMIHDIGLDAEIARQIETLGTSIGLQPVNTKGTRAAMMGEANTEIFDDYRGVPVLSSYRPLALSDVRWVIMSEIDEAETMSSAEQLKRRTAMLMVLFLGGILAISFAFAKTMTRPIKVLTAKANALAQGDLGIAIDVSGGDEIAQLSRSFDTMRKALAELIGGLEENVRERTADLTRANDELTSVNSVILRWGPTGNVLYINPFGLKLFGFSEKEIIGKHLVGTILPEHELSGRDLKEMIDDILDHPLAYESNENETFCRDGRTLWMTWRNKPVVDEAGALREILSVGMDVTTQKNLERELAKANKRMGQELSTGRDIQMSMVPDKFPAFPEHEEFDIRGLLQPAREIGGDFYDYFFIDPEKLCICVGDVSGKGVPAALFMAVTKTLIKATAGEDHSPASIITRVNDEISKDNPSCMFITLFLGILHIRSGEFRYTNAGHPYPYLKRASGDVETLGQVHGPVVGAVDGMAYGEGCLQLGKDDQLLIFTDGVTEAMDVTDQLYGERRVIEYLQSAGNPSPDALVAGALESVETFAGEAEQADDVTILTLDFCIEPEDVSAQALEIIICNKLEEIDTVNDAFTDFAEQCGIPMSVSLKVNMVFDELLNNIISYGYGDEEQHNIDVALECSDDHLLISISDDGVPFNPFTREDPDTTLSLDERSIGGLGIHLVKNVMDETKYQRRHKRNIVTLIKKLKK
jgi:PAS domain S-box-containing protein